MSGEKIYSVERILKHRKIKRTGKIEYLVKWENFPELANTWEPGENFTDKIAIDLYLERCKGPKKVEKLHQLTNAIVNQTELHESQSMLSTLNGLEENHFEIRTVQLIFGEKMAIISHNHDQQNRFIRMDVLSEKYPQKVISFYEKCIKWINK